MEKILKLYKKVNGSNFLLAEIGIPILSESGQGIIAQREYQLFPYENDNIVIYSFEYNAYRMGAAPSITAKIKYKKCLDNLWDNNVYAEFNGEKYFVMSTPSSSKSNEDERYEHDIELKSEREILNHVYFIDAVQGDSEIDKKKSNSDKVEFSGDIKEFVARLNSSIAYAGLDYTAVIDEGIVSDTQLVSFEKTFILQALQEIYNLYKLPYYFVGKTIHIGYEENAIVTPFKYGSDEALLSISKENANYKVVNRCSGLGSENNIPYYYPNKTPKGDVSVTVQALGGGSLTSSDIAIEDLQLFASAVSLNDKFIAKYLDDFGAAEVTDVKVRAGKQGNFYYPKPNYEQIARFTKSGFTYSAVWYIKTEIDVKYPCKIKLDLKDSQYCVIYPITTQYQSTVSMKSVCSIDGGSDESVGDIIEAETAGKYVVTTKYTCVVSSVPIPKPQYCNFYYNMSLDGTKSLKWTLNGKQVHLEDLGLTEPPIEKIKEGDLFFQEAGEVIPFSTNLMPPIYRESNGKDRFYNAKNNTYLIPPEKESYYEFENEYDASNPEEMIVDFPDIKPTIVGMTNAAGQRIDRFLDFAYDKNDSDEVDSEGNCVHKYFFAKLPKTDGEFGFNLFDHANEKQTMQVSFTSGNCGSCTFEIGVGEETQKNIVQVDENGDLMYDEETGNVLWENQAPQDRQNDTRTNEVWIALKKDNSTFTNVMPNVNGNLKPSTEDDFVLLGITLPDQYILKAEYDLKEAIIKYMYMNNVEKFNISIKFSRIYLAEHPEVVSLLNENARIIVEYNEKQYTLYVDSYSYKMNGEDALPEIEVSLVDSLAIGNNTLQNMLDQIKQDILFTSGGGDFLKQGLLYFIRKDVDDATKGSLTIGENLKVGQYKEKTSGAIIRQDGSSEMKSLSLRSSLSINDKYGIGENGEAVMSDIEAESIQTRDFLAGVAGKGFSLKKGKDGYSRLEVDELFVRLRAYFTELEIKKITYSGGNFIFSPAGVTLSVVIEEAASYKCFFNNDDDTSAVENLFKVDDLALCQTFNVKEGIYENVSNKRYWRRVIEVGEGFIKLSKTDCEMYSGVPAAGDNVVVLGNKTDAERQNAIALSVVGENAPSIIQYKGINDYTLEEKEKTVISPTLNKFTGDFFLETGESITDVVEGVEGDIEGIKSSITVMEGEISLKASQEEVTELGKRITEAELNLQPDNIWLGISSKVEGEIGEVTDGLIKTGINITTNEIAVISDKFYVQNTSGEKIAVFTDGKITASLIDAGKITVKELDTTDESGIRTHIDKDGILMSKDGVNIIKMSTWENNKLLPKIVMTYEDDTADLSTIGLQMTDGDGNKTGVYPRGVSVSMNGTVLQRPRLVFSAKVSKFGNFSDRYPFSNGIYSFSVTKQTKGRYRVTHNLNTTAYYVLLTVMQNGKIATVYLDTKADTYFEYTTQAWNGTNWEQSEHDVELIVAYNPTFTYDA